MSRIAIDHTTTPHTPERKVQMIRETGDMLVEILDRESVQTDLILFTASSTVRKYGDLVMSTGIARAIKDRYPYAPKFFGDSISMIGKVKWTYGVIIYSTAYMQLDHTKLGLFQTKIRYSEKSTLSLIGYSTIKLIQFLQVRDYITRVDMNMPGTGQEGLTEEDVMPIISDLPDLVHVWTSTQEDRM